MGKRRQERRAAQRASEVSEARAKGNAVGSLGAQQNAGLSGTAVDINSYPLNHVVTAEELNELRRKSENVDVEKWINVRPDQVVAAGTYVDEEGILRETSSGSTVVWHNKNPSCGKSGTVGEWRKGILPEEIIYDDNGAPWCPSCVAENQRKKLVAKAIEDSNKAHPIKVARDHRRRLGLIGNDRRVDSGKKK